MMRTFKHALNLVGGVILLPFAILCEFWPGLIVVCLILAVIDFVVKCW